MHTLSPILQKTIPIRDREVAYASELDDRHRRRSGGRIYAVDRQAQLRLFLTCTSFTPEPIVRLLLHLWLLIDQLLTLRP